MIRQKQNSQANGFTLLELLIVITIIVGLMSLSVVVMINLTSQAEEAATVTTIGKINGLIDQRIEAFDRAFPAVQNTWETNFRGYVASEIATRNSIPEARALNLLTRFTSNSPVWSILARKAAYRQEFPQRFFDLDLLDDATRESLTPNYLRWPATVRSRYLGEVAIRLLKEEGDANPAVSAIQDKLEELWTNHNPNTESAEMLYFMVFHSGTYGSGAEGEDSFRSSEIADTDNDGMPEFVDAWGNPLRFYRWPTRLMDPSLPIGAFAGANPDRDNLDEVTDLQMVVGVDGSPSVIAAANGRSITESERGVADILVKGIPRRLNFSPAYISSIAAGFTDRPGVADVNVIIPPDPLLRDPDDPAGLLYALLEDGLFVAGTAVDMTWEFNEVKYHTPDTFHAPLIVSAGEDGVLGLFEPNQEAIDTNGDGTQDTVVLGNLANYDQTVPFDTMIDQLSDNLTNRNRRAGGKR